MRHPITTAVVLAVVCFIQLIPANAQEKSDLEFRATFGGRNAMTEGTCADGGGQAMGGASLRVYLNSRLSTGPEIMLYSACERQTFTFYHPQLSGLMHLAFDVNPGEHRLKAYFIGGVGFVHHRALPGRSSRNRLEYSGGFGTRIFISDRMFVAPEVQGGGQVGFARFSVSLGLMFR
jgi:hypothetical protein